MKARFRRFTNSKNLNEMLFRIPKDVEGFRQLQDVFLNTEKIQKIDEWDFTLNEIEKMKNFKVKNENGRWSKYKTSKGFINRLKKSI